MSDPPSQKRQKRLSNIEVEEVAERFESQITNDEDDPSVKEAYRSFLNQYYEILMPPRLQMERWKSLDRGIRTTLALSIQDKHNKKSIKLQRISKKLPIFECQDTLVEFVLIPGGRFSMGLSDGLEEELYELIVESFDVQELTYDEVLQTENGAILRSVEQMRPVQDVVVSPYLLAVTPLLYRQAKSYLPSFPPPVNLLLGDEDDSSEGASSNDEVEKEAFWGVTLSDKALRSVLQDDRFRLPSEAEWEYAARGGGKDVLFPFGESRIPTEDDLEFSFRPHSDHRPNKLNLRGLGSFFELCSDIWRDDLKETPSDGSPQLTSGTISPIRVVRGGSLGSWQDCGEWQNMLVYARHPHRPQFPVAVRLTMSVL